VRRTLYKPLGLAFLALAIIGILVPLLPGTPFLLLSAWFFARSSEAWHQRLLANEVSGPIIRNWEENRCMSLRTKVVAIGSMLGAGGASVLFAVQALWLKLLGIGLLAIGTAAVLGIPTCRNRVNIGLTSNIDPESKNEATREKAGPD
jgi:uncharacterized membrane protein YbaN (DUF454 family)